MTIMLLISIQLKYNGKLKPNAFNRTKSTLSDFPEANLVLNVKRLNYKRGNEEIIKDLTFQIKQNEIIGLLGPNGSGKTTLINILLGIIKP
jgi:ABC-type polysaccharide/polyol phosphate transport system ATPase subunit